MSNLQRAIEIAVEAHRGQVDKAGAPYVLHPLRIMLTLRGDDERVAAVLHDVVEDCPGWSFERLEAEGFSTAVIRALRAVTKTAEEEAAIDGARGAEEKYRAYEAFVLRAVQDPVGRAVKLADLTDNCDASRLGTITAKDEARLARYRRVLDRLRDIAKSSPR